MSYSLDVVKWFDEDLETPAAPDAFVPFTRRRPSFEAPSIPVQRAVMIAALIVAAPAAPVAFRSAASTTNASGTSNVINKPAGVVSGDLLILRVGWTTGTVSSVPAGFVEFTSGLGTYTGWQQRCYWKIAGGSEPATYTVNFSGTVYSDCDISAYTGADQTTPLGVGDAENTVNAGNATPTATGLSITASRDSSLLVHLAVTSVARTSGPAGMTNRLNYDTSIYVDTVSVDAGATGNKTSTFATVGSWVVHMAVIRPALGAAADPVLRLPQQQQQMVQALWASPPPMQRQLAIAAVTAAAAVAAKDPSLPSPQALVASLWAPPALPQQRGPLDAAILAAAVAQVDTVLRPPLLPPVWPPEPPPQQRGHLIAGAIAAPDTVLQRPLPQPSWLTAPPAPQRVPAVAAIFDSVQIDTVLRTLPAAPTWPTERAPAQRVIGVAAISATQETTVIRPATSAGYPSTWPAAPAPVQRQAAVAAIAAPAVAQVDAVLRPPVQVAEWPADAAPTQRIAAVAAIVAPQPDIPRAPAQAATLVQLWTPPVAPVQRLPSVAAISAIVQVDAVLKPVLQPLRWPMEPPPVQRAPSVAAITSPFQADVVLRAPEGGLSLWPADSAPVQRRPAIAAIAAAAPAAPDTALRRTQQQGVIQALWLPGPPPVQRPPAAAAILAPVAPAFVPSTPAVQRAAAALWTSTPAAPARALGVAALPGASVDTVLRPPSAIPSAWPPERAPTQRVAAIAAVFASEQRDTVLRTTSMQAQVAALWTSVPPAARMPAVAAITAPAAPDTAPFISRQQEMVGDLWLAIPGAAYRRAVAAAILAPPVPPITMTPGSGGTSAILPTSRTEATLATGRTEATLATGRTEAV